MTKITLVSFSCSTCGSSMPPAVNLPAEHWRYCYTCNIPVPNEDAVRHEQVVEGELRDGGIVFASPAVIDVPLMTWHPQPSVTTMVLPAQSARGLELDPDAAAFVQRMQVELQANAHKGPHGSWKGIPAEVLWNDLMYHAAKLIYAMKHHEHDQVLEFAAVEGKFRRAFVERYPESRTQIGTED